MADRYETIPKETMMRPMILFMMLLWARSAAADPKSDAAKLASEAEALLQRCPKRTDCSPRREATRKFQAAYQIDPDLRYASMLCTLADDDRHPDALMMCDVAASLGGDEAARKGARMIRASRTTYGEDSQTAAVAARALYGVGLELNESDDSATLAFAAVTEAKMQELIRDHYVGLIDTVEDLRSPEKKREACDAIAKRIRDREQRRSTENFCLFAAAREANAQPLTFGGATGTERVPLDSGPAFAIDAKLRYQPMFVLGSTKKRLDTPRSIMLQRWFLDAVVARGQEHPSYKEALAMLAETQAEAKKAKASVERTLKAMQANKTKILFLPYQPEPRRGDVPAPLKGHVADCSTLYVVGPEQATDTELVVKVDGEICIEQYSSDAFLRKKCEKAFAVPGKHRVDAELYRTSWKKTGAKRVTVHSKDTIDVRDEEYGERGARVARGQITCGG